MSSKVNKPTQNMTKTKSATTAPIAETKNKQTVATNEIPAVHSGDLSTTWMGKKNTYLAALRDPFGVTGVRIPNGEASSTATMQVVYRTQVVSNNNTGNVAGVLFGYSGSGQSVGTTLIPHGSVNCAINGGSVAGAMWLSTHQDASSGGSSSQVFFDGTAVSTGSKPLTVANLPAFMLAYASQVRVVSFALTMRPAVSATQNAGFILGGSLSSNFLQSQSMNAVNMSIDALLNYPGAARVATSSTLNGGGVTVTYTPYDTGYQQFSPAGAASSYVTPGYTSFNPCMMYVVATGGGAANLSYLVDFAINYEIVPASGSFAFIGRPSLDDPIAIATAMNARKLDPLVYPGSVEADQSAGSLSGESNVNLSTLKAYAIGQAEALAKVGQSLIVTSAQPGDTLTCHMALAPCRAPLSKVKGKIARRESDLEELEEQPIFESLVDDVGLIAKKALPRLASFLPGPFGTIAKAILG